MPRHIVICDQPLQIIKDFDNGQLLQRKISYDAFHSKVNKLALWILVVTMLENEVYMLLSKLVVLFEDLVPFWVKILDSCR